MPLRVSSLLRAAAYFFQCVVNALTIFADILEQLGLCQDVDTLLWIVLIFCLVKRRFTLLFSIVGLVVVSAPVWNISGSSDDSVSSE